MSSTSERLRQIMQERRLKQVDIIRLAQPYCGEYGLTLSKSDMSQFISGKVKPGPWKLKLLSLSLNVSEAWLAGFDVPRECGDAVADSNSTDERKEFYLLFMSLSPENRRRIVDLMKALAYQ